MQPATPSAPAGGGPAAPSSCSDEPVTPGGTKKSFWKWSPNISVPGSIRALTNRGQPGVSKKRSKKVGNGGSVDDDVEWDESEDEIIAAFAQPPPGATAAVPKHALDVSNSVDLSDMGSSSLASSSTPTMPTLLRKVSSDVSIGSTPRSPVFTPTALSESSLAKASISAPVSRSATTITGSPRPTERTGSQTSVPETMTELNLPDISKLTIMSPTKIVPSVASLDGKRMKFRTLINAPVIDIDELRKLSWNGVPDEFRPLTWKLLMGYLPMNKERRQATLERKRLEYMDSVEQNFGENAMALDQKIFHQIHIDVPRTNPDVKLFQHETVQRCLERILYVWAIRHPASGYVQGINDLVTPFFIVFLSSHIPDETDPEEVDPAQFSKDVLMTVEADSYWCLSKLLEGIQDNYTQSQPGIQRRVFMLKELVQRIDAPLHNHLQQVGVEFLQFSFRWMNCLLMREMSLNSTIRMWDTYMAEGVDGYANFHLYVCAAFIISWTKTLQKMDSAEEMLMFLQDLPSQKWANKDVEILLSEAYMWKSLYQNAPSHLNSNH